MSTSLYLFLLILWPCYYAVKADFSFKNEGEVKGFIGEFRSKSIKGQFGRHRRADNDEDEIDRSYSAEKEDKIVTEEPVSMLAPFYYILAPVIYTKCGLFYSCLSYPRMCHRDGRCFVTMSYLVKNDHLHIVLSATTTSYVAVGFSTDQRMGDDAVIICRKSHADDQIEIWQGFNLPALNKGTIIQTKNTTIFEARAGSFYEGVVSCEFSLPMSFSTENGLKYQFLTKEYFILLAVGNDNNNPSGPGSITQHGFSLVSREPVFLGSTIHRILEASTYYSIFVHECLVIITYGFFMPIGIFVARFGQQAFPYKAKISPIQNYPSWILIHIAFQVTCVLGNIANVLIIYIGRIGSAVSSPSSFFHAVIGPITFLASIVNLILGFIIHKFKIDKKPYTKKMKVLQWTHWVIGHSCYNFGVLEMIRGPYIKKSWVSCSFSVIAVLAYIFYLGCNVLLLFNTDYLRRKHEMTSSTLRAYLGPAIRLQVEADRRDYRIRRRTTYFLVTSFLMFAIFLFVELLLSERSCDISCPDYI